MIDFLRADSFLFCAFVVAFSFVITSLAVPSILHVARFRHLYDDLGHFRKEHDHGIPRLGGVAIFVSFTITALLFSMTDKSLPINFTLAACILLFAMGLKDDLAGVNPRTKFIIQFLVGAILVIPGNIRLTSMYGVFGIEQISYTLSIFLSIAVIMLVMNAFNLIDGIDGLAAVTGIIVNGVFAALFIFIHQYQLAAVALAMVGAVMGFLRFNITPAKIFMGDTGSLLIGLISAVLAVKFIEVTRGAVPPVEIGFSVPALVVAILIGPVFDTLRVFTLRIANGGSPFTADRNHIHHRMLKLGLSHLQATAVLGSLHFMCIALVVFLPAYNSSILIGMIILIPMIFNWAVTFCIRSKERSNMALRNLFA